MDARLTGGFLTLSAILAAAGCIISQEELAGSACSFDADCPEAYACVGPEGQRSCQVIYPPPPGSTPDGGMADGGTVDAGPVPTYCKEIRPILNSYCLSNCHGPVTDISGHPEFRLDYYEPDAGQPKGAREMAPRIKVRAVDRLPPMPPGGNPAPSAAERALLGRWVVGGAPFCDGGTP